MINYLGEIVLKYLLYFYFTDFRNNESKYIIGKMLLKMGLIPINKLFSL